MLQVFIKNTEYSFFQNLVVDAALDNILRSFTMEVLPKDFYSFPVDVGDEIFIEADQERVFTGFVEKISDNIDVKSHSVSLSGRSRTADLVDSTIDGSVTFSAQINLKTVTETLIQNLYVDLSLPAEFESQPDPRRLPQVIVEDDIEDFLKNESLSEDIGSGYFEIIEKFARKRQVLVTTNGNSDIVFTRGKGKRLIGNLSVRNTLNNPLNNVKSSQYVRDHSQLFNIYSCNSEPQKGGFFRLSELPPDALLLAAGRVIDGNIRSSRKLYFNAENASDKTQAENRGVWEGVVRRSRSTSYKAVVQGHSFNNEIWDINKVANVLDELRSIDSNMLINSISYKENVKTGSDTSLSLINPNAYVIPEKSLLDTSFFDDLSESVISGQ